MCALVARLWLGKAAGQRYLVYLAGSQMNLPNLVAAATRFGTRPGSDGGSCRVFQHPLRIPHAKLPGHQLGQERVAELGEHP